MFNWCLLRIVVITIGSVCIRSWACVYSGFIKDEDAPVSIRNLSGRPKGEDIFTQGRINPCLFISKYPKGLSRHVIENLNRQLRRLVQFYFRIHHSIYY